MYTFLMVIFIILCLFLALFILLQQGKGDMGLGGLGGSTQMLFGGSGGQEFFERITWFLGALFIFGSLGLAILKSKEVRESRLEGFTVKDKGSMLPQIPTDLLNNARTQTPAEPQKGPESTSANTQTEQKETPAQPLNTTP